MTRPPAWTTTLRAPHDGTRLAPVPVSRRVDGPRALQAADFTRRKPPRPAHRCPPNPTARPACALGRHPRRFNPHSADRAAAWSNPSFGHRRGGPRAPLSRSWAPRRRPKMLCTSDPNRSLIPTEIDHRRPVGIDRPSSELSGAGQPRQPCTLRAFEGAHAGEQEVVRAQDSRGSAAALRRRAERPRDRSQPACVAVDGRRLRASRRGRGPGLAGPGVRPRRRAGATAVATPPPSGTSRPLPAWSHVHQELWRKGVTLSLLWQEYKATQPEGLDALRPHNLHS